MTVDLLPSIHVPNFLTHSEVDNLALWIQECSQKNSHIGRIKGDRFEGKLIANYHQWKYYDSNIWSSKIRDLLEPKFQQLFPEYQTIFHSHILESIIPYQLHSDYYHNDAAVQISKYTILIPLHDYDSNTVVFNEYLEDTNEFEQLKRHRDPYTELKIDPKFCANHLSHLHPKDLKYLSLKETFKWNKGDFFAMDRKYIHCSDNFNKKGIDKKLGIVIWTGIPKT